MKLHKYIKMSEKISKVDYSKGLIYKLCCKDVSIKEEYVGSTTNFRVRKNNHKYSCCNPQCKKYNRKVYQYIRENGGFDNWDMILVEYYNCNNKKELEKRERFWIEELKATLNCCIPTRESDEYNKHYYQNNKEKIKEYYKTNKETILNYKSEWYKRNKARISEIIRCECGCEISKKNLVAHKKTKKHISLMENK